MIKNELDKVCALLSDPKECEAMVEDYTDMIVKMLVQYAKPEEICQAIGKCKKGARPVDLSRMTCTQCRQMLAPYGDTSDCQALEFCPEMRQLTPTATKCDLCKVVMDLAEDELKDEATDEKIIAVVEKLCTFVPPANREDCHRMVEIEGMLFIRMLAQSVNASTICETIRFCPR